MNDMDSNSLPLNDHDLLIKLDTKMDSLATSFKDFQVNLITRVARTETRLDQEDLYHAAIPLKQMTDDWEWVKRIRSNWHFLIGAGVLLSATLGAFINSTLTKWLHL